MFASVGGVTGCCGGEVATGAAVVIVGDASCLASQGTPLSLALILMRQPPHEFAPQMGIVAEHVASVQEFLADHWIFSILSTPTRCSLRTVMVAPRPESSVENT